MKAALGGVSADGMGTPEFDVPQSGGDPCAFIAIQPGGNAGGASPSKFSLSTNGIIQGGEHEGVGNGASAAQPTSSGEVSSPVRWPIAREELITAAANATAAVATIANDVVRLIEPIYITLSVPFG
jgi:hypothetical protein